MARPKGVVETKPRNTAAKKMAAAIGADAVTPADMMLQVARHYWAKAVDESGQIRVYWWEPTRAANPATDVWSLDTLASAGFKRGEKLSVSFDQTSGRIRIYGPSNANDLPTSLSWAPGDGGRWSFDEA